MGLSNVYGVPGLGSRSPATIIDGREVAARERLAVVAGVRDFAAAHGGPPALATLLIADDPASAVYVRS